MSTALSQSQAEQFWGSADSNKDGRLTLTELANALRSYKADIKESNLAGMFCGLDQDEDKYVSKKEFLDEMVNKQKRSDYFQKKWREHDRDGNRQLSRGEVMTIIKEYFAEDQVSKVIGQFLCYCDLDGNGVVSEQEYFSFFC